MSWFRSPRVYGTAITFVGTLAAYYLFPLYELQTYFWAGAVVFFLIGDSVTTALFERYDLEEMRIGYTRWVCGAQPSAACSFGTRLLVFLIAGGTYWAIAFVGLGVEQPHVAVTGLLIPVVLTFGGLAATIINGYAIFLRIHQSGNN